LKSYQKNTEGYFELEGCKSLSISKETKRLDKYITIVAVVINIGNILSLFAAYTIGAAVSFVIWLVVIDASVAVLVTEFFRDSGSIRYSCEVIKELESRLSSSRKHIALILITIWTTKEAVQTLIVVIAIAVKEWVGF
jgi:hypothetical protein